MNKLYVQYGCGHNSPEAWLNFDSSPTLYFERIPILGRIYTKNKERFPENVRYGDIVKGLPVPPNSCNGAYACHVLEHLSLEECRTAIKNTFVILGPRGIFRLVVPDLEIAARVYVECGEHDAAENFMRATLLGKEKRQRTFRTFLTAYLGNSLHLWMWDYKSLKNELELAGFTDIRRCEYNDSTDNAFKDVESLERFADAVAIECRKP